jgi:hypothetical protein
LEGVAMEDDGIFHGHFGNFPAIYIFHGHLVYFHPFWNIFPRFGTLQLDKSGNPVFPVASSVSLK